MQSTETDAEERAHLSLEGLSVGDAFGERFFVNPDLVDALIDQRAVPRAPWHWTDDTAMALSVVETLVGCGRIDPDSLARRFAERYMADPHRGYGGTAHEILQAIARGTAWREASQAAFGGQGSMGNGGAMRAGPVGAYFADDLGRVVDEARASASPTHAHPEGQAGAIAVAVAAALAWRSRGKTVPATELLLGAVAEHTPPGATHDGLRRACTIPASEDPRAAARALGNGSQVISADTVPFALWCAARHLDDFDGALWTTVAGLGDRDTTCAIVGSVVIVRTGLASIPAGFHEAREPLDSRASHVERFAAAR